MQYYLIETKIKKFLFSSCRTSFLFLTINDGIFISSIINSLLLEDFSCSCEINASCFSSNGMIIELFSSILLSFSSIFRALETFFSSNISKLLSELSSFFVVKIVSSGISIKCFFDSSIFFKYSFKSAS